MIRAGQGRRVQTELKRLFSQLQAAPIYGEQRVEVPQRGGRRARVARLRLRATVVELPAPKGREALGPLRMNAVWAEEDGHTETPLNGLLLTSEAIGTRDEVKAVLSHYTRRWLIGVSSQGHTVQSVAVRPRPRDSGLVAWEAPWRESKTVEPSDNRFRKEQAQHTRWQRAVNAEVAS